MDYFIANAYTEFGSAELLARIEKKPKSPKPKKSPKDSKKDTKNVPTPSSSIAENSKTSPDDIKNSPNSSKKADNSKKSPDLTKNGSNDNVEPKKYSNNGSPKHSPQEKAHNSKLRSLFGSQYFTFDIKPGGSSNEDLSDSTEVSIQKSHVRSRLRKFFAKRPAMEVLVKKGIYKDEPVFGRKLEEVCPATSPRVPDFVRACVKEIESSEENMCTDGLYRASGNLSQVQKIRLEIDQNNLSVIENNTDIHVLTGSLKLFFRELKEPLIPCSVFDRVLAACSLKPRETRIKEFRDIVHALPQCNRDTLKFLLEHLLKVTQYSERNRMHTANLAIVFGPTLLWAPAEQAHNIAIDCIQQNNVVDILLNEYKEIFSEDKGKKKA